MSSEVKTSKVQRTEVRKQKKSKSERVMDWSPISEQDADRCLDGFLHFTSKTVNSNVGDVSIRLERNKKIDGLPYLGLSTLGADFSELDYTEGGAAFVRKPRQIRDIVSKKSSGVIRDKNNIPKEDLERLKDGGPFVRQLSQPLIDIPKNVPSLLKQIIVPNKNGEDVALTPINAMGLNSIIIDRLNKELEKRESEAKAPLKKFWRSGTSALGGKKPQNIGLVCTVKDGPKVASFALLFQPPKPPSLSYKRRLSTLFRKFSYRLSKSEADLFKNTVENYMTSLDFHSERSLSGAVKKIAYNFNKKSRLWKEEFTKQLIYDAQDSDMSLPANPVGEFLDGRFIPKKNDTHWNKALDLAQNDTLYKGYLSKEYKTMLWKKEVAQALTSAHLSQVKATPSQVIVEKIQKMWSEEIR